MEWDRPFFLSRGAVKALWQSTQHTAANGTGQYALPTPQATRQSTAHPQVDALPQRVSCWEKQSKHGVLRLSDPPA